MPNEEELDRIIAELDRPYDGALPEQALRDAQRCPAAITPRLIGLIESATARIQAGEPVENGGHFLALFLLSEFRATEAWPAIRAAISLPDDGLFSSYLVTSSSIRWTECWPYSCTHRMKPTP